MKSPKIDFESKLDDMTQIVQVAAWITNTELRMKQTWIREDETDVHLAPLKLHKTPSKENAIKYFQKISLNREETKQWMNEIRLDPFTCLEAFCNFFDKAQQAGQDVVAMQRQYYSGTKIWTAVCNLAETEGVTVDQLRGLFISLIRLYGDIAMARLILWERAVLSDNTSVFLDESKTQRILRGRQAVAEAFMYYHTQYDPDSAQMPPIQNISWSASSLAYYHALVWLPAMSNLSVPLHKLVILHAANSFQKLYKEKFGTDSFPMYRFTMDNGDMGLTEMGELWVTNNILAFMCYR